MDENSRHQFLPQREGRDGEENKTEKAPMEHKGYQPDSEKGAEGMLHNYESENSAYHSAGIDGLT